MEYKPLWVCGVISMLFSLNIQAQDTRTLTQFWEQSFAAYPTIKKQQAALRQADQYKKLVGIEYLPQIQLQAQNTVGFFQEQPGAFFPLPGVFNVSSAALSSGGNTSNLVGSGVVNWEFLQFGKHRIAMEAAQTQLWRASSQLDETQLSVQTQLTQDYVNLLFSDHMYQWAIANVQRFQDLFVITQSRTRAGLSPAADSLLVRASLQQAKADQREWKGKQQAGKAMLAKWTGWEQDKIRLSQTYFFSEERIAFSEIDSIQHPALSRQQQTVILADQQRVIANRQALPTVSLLAGSLFRGSSAFGNAEGSNWYDAYNQPTASYLVGVGITWDLSQLYQQPLRNNYLREQVVQQQETLQEINVSLREQQASAIAQLDQQMQQITGAEQAFKSASKAYELFKSRYQSGVIGLTDLLQIQQILQQTEKTRIQAYHQYWKYAVDLAAAQADFSFLAKTFH